MSNELNSNMIPNIKESYINKRIASLNSKSEKLKESEDLKVSKTMKLVLNENKTEEEQIYKKLKKEYIDRDKKAMDKAIEEDEEKENKEIKELILNAKSKYGIETEVIEPLFKIVAKKGFMSLPFIERAMKTCKILKVRNLEDLKENKENLEFLINPFI